MVSHPITRIAAGIEPLNIPGLLQEAERKRLGAHAFHA
jgi:hypothetical protein